MVDHVEVIIKKGTALSNLVYKCEGKKSRGRHSRIEQ